MRKDASAHFFVLMSFIFTRRVTEGTSDLTHGEKKKRQVVDFSKDSSPEEFPGANELTHSTSSMINSEDRVDLSANALGSDLCINMLPIWSQNECDKHTL